MKKVLSVVLALAMLLSLASVVMADYSGDVKIWVAENVVDFTKEQVEAFKAANPEYAGMNVIVEPVGEGDAASNIITDVEAGADIFGFAQDQLARLVAAGALLDVEPENAEVVKAENDAGSVAAVTLGDTMYAYPMTSDNGYFLYYDKSVVTDPTSLEQVLADCEAAGKNFYMEINSGWYQTAFFFGAGCELTFDSDDEGQLVAMNSTYASDNGVKALKSIIKVAASPAFVNGSSISNATNIGAIFRSAAALGMDAVLLTRSSCDPLNRRAVRVSMGSVFLVPWTWIDEISSLHDMGFKTVAMALTDKSTPLDSPILQNEPRLAVIMGTEGDGLPQETITKADYVVRIPMSHGVDSLNVAAASAVAFWVLGK